MNITEEDNLEKQFIPYLEPIINQTLEMVEEMLSEENFDEGEINELLYQLQEDFGEYIHIISPQIRGRILEIHDRILSLDNIYESTDL